MTRRRTIVVAAAAVVIAAIVTTTVLVLQHRSDTTRNPVAATVPVPLSVDHVPNDTVIGVVLTLGEPGPAGSEWNQAAQGAVVAAKRLALGGTSITLAAEDDHGTQEGARQAVAALVQRKVAGIVIATSGDHASAAAAAASQAGVPAIMVYSTPATDTPGVWTTAPSAATIATATTSALAGKNNVVLIDAGADAPEGISPSVTLTPGATDDVDKLARDVAVLTGDRLSDLPGGTPSGTQAAPAAHRADAVVIAADPARQAAIVRALQAANVSVPLVLTSQAASPAFARTLASDDAAPSTQVVTIGTASWGDSVALQQDAAGRAMSAFLSGVRLAADDTTATNLTGDAPFKTVAWAADSRSHDAVVSLVDAVSAAESNDPAKVAAALRGLSLGPENGLAGPKLDFAQPEALTVDATPVYATSQDLGLRPTDNGTAMVWIPGPASH